MMHFGGPGRPRLGTADEWIARVEPEIMRYRKYKYIDPESPFAWIRNMVAWAILSDWGE